MNDDAALLQSYADDGSQDAFAELVRRHLALVYHSALRHCDGDPRRAEDVAQLVFTDLARKAPTLARRAPLLVAWLHTATRHAAAHLRRTEARRRAREQVAFAMSETDLAAPDPAADWERLRPLIDDALQSLGERDRAAVLLRFFENRPYAELAAALSVTEDAARVRVNRALEKLRAALARRGLVSTSAALALALVQPALAATPPGLAASVTAASLASATAAAAVATTGALGGISSGLAAATVMSTAKIAALTAGTLALLSLGVAVYRHPPAAARASASHPEPILSASDLAAILHPARLAPAEAAAALAAYLALPALAVDATLAEFTERSTRLRALLTVLPPAQFEHLLAATASRTGVSEHRLREFAFTAWTELDAPAAARWVAALETTPAIKSGLRAHFASEAALAWARTDFDASYAWATGLRPGLARHIGGELLARLVITDSARAVVLARAGDLEFFNAVCPRIFRSWIDHDPAAAFTTLGPEIFATPDSRARLPDQLAHWAWLDPRAALAWFDAQAFGESYQRSHQLSTFISSFARRDPPPDFDALGSALVARAEAGLNRDQLAYFLRSWMTHDSRAALRWLDALPDASLRMGMLQSAIRDGIYAEPEKAVALVLALAHRLPPGAEREKTLDEVLGTWSRRDPAAALAWLESPEGATLAGANAARVVRIGAFARQDPAAALSLWNGIESADTRRDTAPGLARAWAANEPDAAAAWLFAQIPEGVNPYDQHAVNALRGAESEAFWTLMQPYTSHAYAYGEISPAWIARDPTGFVAWAESLPTPSQQRGALFSLTWDAAARGNTDLPDPTARLALLGTLRDPEVREPLMRGYLATWLRFDEASALRWAAAHDAASLLPATENPAR